MDKTVLANIYSNQTYLKYLRYNPKWYMILERYPQAYKEFEKKLKMDLKLTTSDRIENFQKQLNFINSMIKYLNSN